MPNIVAAQGAWALNLSISSKSRHRKGTIQELPSMFYPLISWRTASLPSTHGCTP
uniref:Uncharacterized protein n=1 Tax=Arundo donax TaxID=35708 RepID=A0A0A9AHG1_ARUDO